MSGISINQVSPSNPKPIFLSARMRLGARLLATFAGGHGALQLLNVVTGIYLLRTLSLEGYAQYSLAFAFQTTAIALTNLGLTDSIVPLVGSRGDDPALVGRYVRAAQSLRNRLFVFVAPAVALAFYLVVRTRGWSNWTLFWMFVPILASLYLSVSVAGWSAPLLLKRRLGDFYLAQTIPSMARLLSYVIANTLRQLNSGFALLMNAAAIVLNGLIARSRSAAYVRLPTGRDRATESEVIRCMLPMVPAAVFTAFQPQVALFLVSIFGETVQIAQIAALSRIVALFAIFNTFNSVLIEPYVARLSPERLPAIYLRILGCATLLGASVSLLAFAFPWLLTWILGAKYSNLRDSIGWVVLASSVSSVANVMWVMNRGRRWLFWRGSAVEIGCLLIFQSLYVIFIGVRTIETAAMFMLSASAAHLVAHGYVAMYAFSRYAPKDYVAP